MAWKKLKKFKDWNVAGFSIFCIFFFLLGILIGTTNNKDLAEKNKTICQLEYIYRLESFRFEKEANEKTKPYGLNGFTINWNANKKFNKECSTFINYHFPENLNELNKEKNTT